MKRQRKHSETGWAVLAVNQEGARYFVPAAETRPQVHETRKDAVKSKASFKGSSYIVSSRVVRVGIKEL